MNKTSGLVHAGRCLFNIFSNQKRIDACSTFDDGEVEMVVFVHMDDILAHAQATMEMFAAGFGETFKVKSMVETFGVEKTSRTLASSGVSTLSPSGLAANSGGGGRYVEVLVLGGSGGAHVDGNDDTAECCVRGTHYGQILEPWTGALLNDGDVGHTLPASHERVGVHVR